MADADGLEIATDRSWLLLRPAEVIMPLPVAQRWEFTRRHPYYLQFWQAALRYHDSPSDEPLERLYEEVAVQILGGISVAESMRPPDPPFWSRSVLRSLRRKKRQPPRLPAIPCWNCRSGLSRLVAPPPVEQQVAGF